jgi:hypothetical protein
VSLPATALAQDDTALPEADGGAALAFSETPQSTLCGATLTWTDTPEDGAGVIAVPSGFIRSMAPGDDPYATSRRFCLAAPGRPDLEGSFLVHHLGSIGLGIWTLGARKEDYPFDYITLANSNGVVRGTLHLQAGEYRLSGSTTELGVTKSTGGTLECQAGEDEGGTEAVDGGPEGEVCLLESSPSAEPETCATGPMMLGPAAGPLSSSAFNYEHFLDVAVVADAALVAGLANGIDTLRSEAGDAAENMQMAFDISFVGSRIRIVAVEQIAWAYNPAYDDDANGLMKMGEWLRWLHANPGADGVRAASGADEVVGVTINNVQGAGGGSASAPANPTATPEPDGAEVVVTWDGLVFNFRHELGHELGIEHDWANDCDTVGGRREEGCGYSMPWGPYALCNNCGIPAPGCVDVPPFSDIMSKAPGDSPNFYADPCIRYFNTAGPDGITNNCDDTFGSTFGGSAVTEQMPASNMMANGPLTIRYNMPVVSAYNTENPLVRGAELDAPAAGSTVVGPTSPITWNHIPGALNYHIEVGPPVGLLTSQILVAAPGTTTTVTLPPGAATGQPVKVRIGTEFQYPSGTTHIIWREYRWNTANIVLGCDVEHPGLIPEPTWATADCRDTFLGGGTYQFCMWNAALSTFTCDLDGPGNGGGTISVVSAFTDIDRIYDLVAWGEGEDNEPFCCLFSDPNDLLTDVVVRGTSSGDEISLSHELLTLTDYHKAGVVGTVEALAGPDDIYGAESWSAGYADYLYGQRGGDVIRGGRGPDHIDGGRDGDQLFGECGNDTLRATYSVAPDGLYGGFGDDDLCATWLDHALDGSDKDWAEESDRLYYAPIAVGTIPPSTLARSRSGTCGHLTQHGNTWGTCTTPAHPFFGVCACQGYTLGAAPGDCAATTW